MNRKSWIAVLSVCCLCLAPWSAGAFTIYVNYDNFVPFEACPGPDTPGGTLLEPLGYLPAGSDVAQAVAGATAAQYPNWNYNVSGQPLGGDLIVDWYKARDYHVGSTCRHGAEITTHYEAAPWDPPGLDYIQVYIEFGGSGNDYLRVDGDEDNHPNYFTPDDDRLDYIHVPDPGGLLFGDSPYDSLPEPNTWWGGVTFYTFLASTIGNTITFYDGFSWGYMGECVPEPASLALLAIGAVVLLERRRAAG